ncbi:hypothetical protein N7475_008611 [Penicillium sp. IBT 31633x]|nr:hypothetical protein N7475_008611 [Penicillium sp. IBT 31633x]
MPLELVGSNTWFVAEKQASISGTAVVIAGDITKRVAQHGVTRKVIVTGFDILASLEELDLSFKGVFGGSVLTPLGPVVGTGIIEVKT